MRTLLVSCALVVSACASQQATQPVHAGPPVTPGVEAPPATPPEASDALPDWEAKVNDPAGAAALLAVAQDFEEHPMPPQIAAAPSQQVFANVLVLHQMTAKRFIGAMHGMEKAIGGNCLSCHVEKQFASDEKDEKRTARKMLLMSQRLNTQFFHGRLGLSCYTCHRGEEHPESEPEGLKEKLAAMSLPPGLPEIPAGAKRADEVYKNLKLLGGLPPHLIVPVMQQVSLSLGQRCDACHVTSDWASDEKKAKKTARQMIAMVESANAELFGQIHDDAAVTCWTCHRGDEHPVKRPARAER
jgi:hypothetical protein